MYTELVPTLSTRYFVLRVGSRSTESELNYLLLFCLASTVESHQSVGEDTLLLPPSLPTSPTPEPILEPTEGEMKVCSVLTIAL